MFNTLKVAAVVLTMSASSAVFAKADCAVHPKSEWMKDTEARAKIESQGYKIKKFKVDGNCYEIYGHDKDGKKVEIYYDTKTLAVVKSEVD